MAAVFCAPRFPGCAVPSSTERSDPQPPSHDLLSRVHRDSGLSVPAFARLMGRDERAMRRWLGGTETLPETFAGQLRRLQRLDVTSTHITLTFTHDA